MQYSLNQLLAYLLQFKKLQKEEQELRKEVGNVNSKSWQEWNEVHANVVATMRGIQSYIAQTPIEKIESWVETFDNT
jgi:hypothetical protein